MQSSLKLMGSLHHCENLKDISKLDSFLSQAGLCHNLRTIPSTIGAVGSGPRSSSSLSLRVSTNRRALIQNKRDRRGRVFSLLVELHPASSNRRQDFVEDRTAALGFLLSFLCNWVLVALLCDFVLYTKSFFFTRF